MIILWQVFKLFQTFIQIYNQEAGCFYSASSNTKMSCKVTILHATIVIVVKLLYLAYFAQQKTCGA